MITPYHCSRSCPAPSHFLFANGVLILYNGHHKQNLKKLIHARDWTLPSNIRYRHTGSQRLSCLIRHRGFKLVQLLLTLLMHQALPEPNQHSSIDSRELPSFQHQASLTPSATSGHRPGIPSICASFGRNYLIFRFLIAFLVISIQSSKFIKLMNQR